jgi:RecB family exonuclease
VVVSATTLTSLLTCPAQWFLEREAGGAQPPSQAQGFGKVVHALADRVAKGDVPEGDDLLADLMQHVDSVWGRIAFRTPWSRSRERTEVEAVLRRYVAWHHRADARRVVATEQQLTAEVTLPDGQQIRLHGYADRLELDEAGRVVVIDLKTSKYPPTDTSLPANPQLGLYQLAVEHGAVDELVGGSAESGGAELVQLRKEVRGKVKVQKQEPQPRNEDGRTEVEVQLMQAVGVIRSETIEARPGKHCENCGFVAICPVKGAGTVLS